MVTVLTGSNSYALTRRLVALTHATNDPVERYDGTDLTTEKLFEIIHGVSLFSATKTVVIKDLSANSEVWGQLDRFLVAAAQSITLILVEPQLDKRTKTYKWLQTNATVEIFEEWTLRDRSTAIQWCITEARQRGVALSPELAASLLRRAGIQQWRLAAALDKLELADEISEQSIEQIVEPHLEENVFELFGAALSGDTNRVETMLQVLATTDDAYRVVALLSTQAVQSAMLLISGKSATVVAAESKLSPYVLSNLTQYTKGRTKHDAYQVLEVMAQADMHMKSTTTDRWTIISAALLNLR